MKQAKDHNTWKQKEGVIFSDLNNKWNVRVKENNKIITKIALSDKEAADNYYIEYLKGLPSSDESQKKESNKGIMGKVNEFWDDEMIEDKVKFMINTLKFTPEQAYKPKQLYRTKSDYYFSKHQ